MKNKLNCLKNFQIIEYSFYSLFLFPIMPPAAQSITQGLFIVVSILTHFPKIFRYIKDKNSILLFFILSGYYIWQLLSVLWSENKNIWSQIHTNIWLIFISFVIAFTKPKINEKDKKICFTIFNFALLGYLALFFNYLVKGLILYQERIPAATNKILYLSSLKSLTNFEIIKLLITDFLSKGTGLYMVAKEAYNYFGEPEFFTHYNYVSPCFLMASLCSVYLFFKSKSILFKFLNFIFTLIFSFFVLYSNAMISKFLLILIPILIVELNFNSFKNKFRIYFIGVTLFLVFCITYKSTIIEKFNEINLIESVYDPSEKQTVIIDYVRYNLYKSSFEIFKENMIFGVGIGDISYEVNKRLPKTYINGIGELGLKNPLNTHSQFIYYLISGGIINLILFGLTICYLAYNTFKKNQFLYFSIIIILFFSCLFENFMARQWGILFFGTFLLILECKVNVD